MIKTKPARHMAGFDINQVAKAANKE